MPSYLALLLSFALHVLVLVGPSWWATPPPPAKPNIEARLVPLAAPTALAETVSTEAKPDDIAMPRRLAAPPRSLQGSSLRRAQAALSKHLFYPPEAVALGLEGEVILLLTLGENGQLVSAAIARGSGHGMLDQAALDAARHIGALPGNPRQTLFPVTFRLQ